MKRSKEHISALYEGRQKAKQKRLEGATTKRCGTCLLWLPFDQFFKGRGVHGLSGPCKSCSKIGLHEWRRNNREKYRKMRNRSYAKMKGWVFEHYGNRCKCCGENEILFLTIDHVNNDGGGRDRDVRGWKMYQSIVKAGYPDSFQVLCWNCNSGRSRNGGVCPHETSRSERHSIADIPKPKQLSGRNDGHIPELFNPLREPLDKLQLLLF